MGIAELRNVFNVAAAPEAICTAARMFYERDEANKEWQRLRFEGTFSDGTAFSIISAKVPPKGLLELAARDIAQTLLKERPK